MKERLVQVIEDGAVHLDLFADELDADALAKRSGQVVRGAREPLQDTPHGGGADVERPAPQLTDYVFHAVELFAELSVQLPDGSVAVEGFEAGLALHQLAHRSQEAVNNLGPHADRSRERRRG